MDYEAWIKRNGGDDEFVEKLKSLVLLLNYLYVCDLQVLHYVFWGGGAAQVYMHYNNYGIYMFMVVFFFKYNYLFIFSFFLGAGGSVTFKHVF